MARTYRKDTTVDSAPKTTGQDARQGQNVKGMLTVLVVSLLVVGAAYAGMLALTQQEQTRLPQPAEAVESSAAPSQNPAAARP